MEASFRAFATTISALCAALFLVLMLSPELIVTLFDMEQASSASVMSRRAAMLFAGYAVMLLSVSTVPHSAARQAMLCGVGTMMLGLACAGVFEVLRGAAGWTMLGASAVETIWAAWALRLFLHFHKAEKDD